MTVRRLTPDDICLAMIAKSSDEDFLTTVESARPYVSRMVIVVAPDDHLLKFRDKIDGATFVERVWDGYATARNSAIELAFTLRPWVLMVDTGDTITGRLPIAGDEEINAFRLPVEMPGATIKRIHLFKVGWKFCGAAHEFMINSTPLIDDWNELVYHSDPGHADKETLRARAELLQLDLSGDDPILKARALFYLGRTFEQLGELGVALQMYMTRLRVRPKCLPEEEFWCMLGVARCSIGLSMPFGAVATMLEHLIRAFPDRAEAVRALAAVYDSRGTELRAVAASMAPPECELWVETSAYGRKKK